MSLKSYTRRAQFGWLDLYDLVRDPRSSIKAWVSSLAVWLIAWLGEAGIPLPDGFHDQLSYVLTGLAMGFFTWLLPNYPRTDRADDRRRFYGR